jgi:hypothetical protein
MSARRWPIYTMPVDSWFQDVSLPRSFPQKVRRYEEQSGKRFRINRWNLDDPNSPKVVRRIA